MESVQNLRSNAEMDNAIEQLLRQHQVQITAQRIAILRAVSALPHATADELTEHVRGVLGAISRQAVYDTLAVLVNKQLLRRIQTAGSAARYEDRVGDSHHHLICRGCGKTFDIDIPAAAEGAVVAGLPARADHGFEIDEVEVTYWGRCPACVRAAAVGNYPRAASGTKTLRGSPSPAGLPVAARPRNKASVKLQPEPASRRISASPVRPTKPPARNRKGL